MRVFQPLLLLLGAALFAAAAFAQSPAPAARGFNSYHPFEIAATYTHVLTDGTYVLSPTLNGFTVSGSAPVLPRVRAAVEFGDYRGPAHSMKSFLAGPQTGFHIYRFQPFVRVLFGFSHAAGVTPFTIAGGGGVNVPLSDHLDLRLLQMDYYRLYGGGAKDGADYLRLGCGIAYEFGSR